MKTGWTGEVGAIAGPDPEWRPRRRSAHHRRPGGSPRDARVRLPTRDARPPGGGRDAVDPATRTGRPAPPDARSSDSLETQLAVDAAVALDVGVAELVGVDRRSQQRLRFIPWTSRGLDG